MELGEAHWDQLAETALAPSPFSTWAFTRAWWDAADSEHRNGTLMVSDGHALLPVRLVGRRLTFATSLVGCPDHLDLIGRPVAPAPEWAAALQALAWDEVAFEGCAAEGFVVRELAAALCAVGASVYVQPMEVAPAMALPPTWDALLSGLPTERRLWLGQKERKAARAGLVFVDHAAHDLDAGIEALLETHASRWGHAGALVDPQLEGLLRRWLKLDPARRILSSAWIGRRPVGAWVGTRFGGTTYFYQSGRVVDPHGSPPSVGPLSVGALLMARQLRFAIEAGCQRFDFLRGAEAYKSSWGARPVPLYGVAAYRRSLRGRLLEAGRTVMAGVTALKERHAARMTALSHES